MNLWARLLSCPIVPRQEDINLALLVAIDGGGESTGQAGQRIDNGHKQSQIDELLPWHTSRLELTNRQR